MLMDALATLQHLFQQLSDITLMPAVIIVTTIIFLILHQRRHNESLAQISILLGFIPVLVHELGHAITASLTRGTVTDIYMPLTPRKQRKTGTQGSAHFVQPFRIPRAIVAFMGYAAPPTVLTLGVYFATRGAAVIFVALLAAGVLYYFWHTSQKWLPLLLLILIGISGIDLATARTAGIFVDGIYSVVLGLLAGEIIQSMIITARINFTGSKQPWDGVELRQLTLIPATVWWLVWTALSIAALTASAYLIMPN